MKSPCTKIYAKVMCTFQTIFDFTSIADISMSAPNPAPNGAADARDPSGFLSEIIGAPVTVKLNSGVVYKGLFILRSKARLMLTNCQGELQSVDGYMNIALEQTKEFVDGKLRRNYGDAFVRGNNGNFENRFVICFRVPANIRSDVHLGGLMKVMRVVYGLYIGT